MALDKVILDHIEEVDELEDQVAVDIDKLINKLNIDAVIENPKQALEQLTEMITKLLNDKYYPEVAVKGLAFAKDVVKDGEIKIDISKDPTLNKELVGDIVDG